MATFRLGVDIGGTFTDIVLLGPDGALHSKKVLSTPDDYSGAIETGVAAILKETGIAASDISEFAHGTTVATNAIIERKGANIALVTTKGFRDILEIGRFRSPRLYDLRFRKPEPLVERRLRFEVPERVNGKGEMLEPVDLAALDTIADRLIAENVQAVAICFINSYVNPENETTAMHHLKLRLPHVPISISAELLPQIQEYERASTTVVNAYIRPVVETYVTSLKARMQGMGLKIPLMIMQSNGGVLPAEQAGQAPVYIIESGPAAGVVGTQRLGAHLGLGDLMVLDMGGTTAKAALIEDGRFSIMPAAEVGGGESKGHRLIHGAGHAVQVPTIDIAEVGAGGGSIATVDAAGGFEVGPRSAGASPGPVCYDLGGEQTTVTDANLLLGYLNPEVLVGGDLRLNFVKAKAALGALGKKLGESVTDTAYGIHQIANANMLRALGAVSSERGRDPSQFTLVAFGGNGGVHASELAETLSISRVVVPPVAGLFSALGLLFADVEHQLVGAFYRVLAGMSAADLNAALEPMVENVLDLLASEGFGSPSRREIEVFADMKYVGQAWTLSVPVGAFPAGESTMAGLAEEFGQAHDSAYGYRSDREPIQFIALKVVGRGVAETPRLPERLRRASDRHRAASERDAYFGPERGWLRTPVVPRSGLSEGPVNGPLVIEEYDATTVVRPGWRACLDGWNNIVIERDKEPVATRVAAVETSFTHVNPVKRELIKNALITITDNMVVTVIRTSRSTVVKNSLDFSTSICDSEGQMVAQGLSLPVHLGATMPALKGCLDYFGDDIHPGDILASNDPYAGASHLNDVFMFKPVYKDDELVLYLSIILHHTDMGGRVPGGNATDSSEIFEEGLRIPPTKIYERGSPNETLFRIIEHNVRVPDTVLGDIRSQIAALELGQRDVLKILDEYGTREFKAYMTELIDYTERRTRNGIAAIPDGAAEFTEWNDDNGVGGDPVRIQVKLTVKGGEMIVDFTGTSPQTTGALNPNFWFTASCAYAAIRAVCDPDIPNNAGFYRPITITAPEGCFVNPVFPAPLGARGQAGHRCNSVVLGALAKLLPGRIPACTGGSEFAVVYSGYDEENKRFLLLEFHNTTGRGGGPDQDGQDAGPYALGNVANTPVEVIEADNPVLIEEYGFLPDTGGAGKYRGGLGMVRQYRLLAEQATVQLRSDRHLHRPWGLFGGGGGSFARSILNPGDESQSLPSKFVRTMSRGNVFRGEMPGSGGHGDPLERNPQAVFEDVRQEKISLEHAFEAYGVVIDPAALALDEAATEARRAELRREQARAPAQRGAEAKQG